MTGTVLHLTNAEFEDLQAIVAHYQPKAHKTKFAGSLALSEEQRAPYERRCALRDRILAGERNHEEGTG
jgi:hypothetical protein